MKGLVKNLGLLLILIGVIILIVCAFTGNVNNNTLFMSSGALIVLGLIAYIIINKRITE
ncbi:MAG: hypothetical protein PHQ88_08805 [Bacteroides sp.]|nr:hypothetical protein [Bacteroides sp.]MDD2645243.1 hypothetical protein [Bacteroides sp.]MDD4720935.1 hypothetical protein [Bacteroides sp.]NLI64496.1 hypothetical protein [Bacteroidales bacterium]